jgi:YbbR domain-containing protein
LKGIFNKDITWKIISICVAIILWLYIVDVQNPPITSTYKDIPVSFLNTDVMEQYNLVFLEGDTQKVNVRLKGRRKAVTRINSGNIRAIIDLSGLKGVAGVSEFSIPIQVELPVADIEIVNQEPYSATVIVDKIVQTQVPIDVITTGEPQDTYVIDEPTINPSKIVIEGPSSILAKVNSAQAIVDVTGYNYDITKVQEYRVIDAEGNIIENEHLKKNTDGIQVSVPIKKRKEIPITHQFIGAPLENYIISGVKIVPESVAIVGKEEVLKDIDEILTEPINIDGITENINVNIPLILQEGITVENNRTTVTVRINVQKEAFKNVIVKNISIINKKNNFDYHIETEELEIQLYGADNLLEHIKPENIKVSVDVSALIEGVQEVPASISVPSGIRVDGEYKVKLKVDKRSN